MNFVFVCLFVCMYAIVYGCFFPHVPEADVFVFVWECQVSEEVLNWVGLAGFGELLGDLWLYFGLGAVVRTREFAFLRKYSH